MERDCAILILGDDPDERERYARLLGRRGCDVICTGDVDAAREQCDRRDFDLLVIDNCHEHWNGVEFLSRLRRDGHDLEVAYVTSLFDQDSRVYSFLTDELDVELVLHHPVSPVELFVQLHDLLDLDDSSSLQEDSEMMGQVDEIQQMSTAIIDDLLSDLRAVVEKIDGREARQQRVRQARRLLHKLKSAVSRAGFIEVTWALGRFADQLLDLERGSTVDIDMLRRSMLTSLRRANEAYQQAMHRTESGPELVGGTSDEDDEGDLEATTCLLVLDPDPDFLEEVETMSRRLLVEPLLASTPQEALELADRHRKIDGLLVDASLLTDHEHRRRRTEHDEDLVERIRQRASSADMPLVVLSSRGTRQERVDAVHAGAVLFLEKPIDTSTFSHAVHQLTVLRQNRRPRVLIVDDDMAFVREIQSALRFEAMLTTHLERTTPVLEEVERNAPDALIIDGATPGISSYDVCRMIRTIPRWQELPLLFLSRVDGTETRIAAFRVGVDDFLAKPVQLEELVARLKVRIERSRLLRERTDHDMLTGLLTRRAFLEHVAARLSEARRNEIPLTLCLVDLDWFKKVNDTHGHLVGDRVLAALGHLLQTRFRFEDLRGRWGGEEFAIALVDETAATAEDVLERVKGEFSRMTFQSEDGESFHVTFSAGLAEFPRDGDDFETLLRTADRNLYLAKKQGRNLIVGT